ncbi:MAG: glutaredoxin [Cryomorphaceae bacterium]|jgi:glutaredoxin
MGYVVIFLDWITRGKGVVRSAEQQEKVQVAVGGLSLYQHQGCPFCVKTRRALHKLSAKIELRDIRKNPSYREQLEVGAGRVKVPCLRIEDGNDVRWMYDSGAIIDYLSQRVNAVG